jgi:phosphoglycolate phosphatase
MSWRSPIIFDLDGTLWDCTDTCVEIWNDVLKTKGGDVVITRQEFQSILGIQHEKIPDILFPKLTERNKREIMNEISIREVASIKQKGGKLFANMKATLKKLARKHKLFIVSNCQKGYIEAFLDYYNLDILITDFECSGNTNKGKADNIRLIIERNKLSNPIYIGDTEEDCIACEEVGIPFIYAGYGFGKNVNSLYKISNFKDLIHTSILEEFN